jgi:hypothetical protein
MVKGEAMIRKYKKLLRQINWFESNAAWKWQVDKLQSEIHTLKNVLVETGILIKHKEDTEKTVIVINGDVYAIRKAK